MLGTLDFIVSEHWAPFNFPSSTAWLFLFHFLNLLRHCPFRLFDCIAIVTDSNKTILKYPFAYCNDCNSPPERYGSYMGILINAKWTTAGTPKLHENTRSRSLRKFTYCCAFKSFLCAKHFFNEVLFKEVMLFQGLFKTHANHVLSKTWLVVWQ